VFPQPPVGVRDLRIGLPDQRLLPDIGAALGSIIVTDITDRRGGANEQALLDLATERFAADGVDTEHLAVVGGALDGIERLLATSVDRGDPVAVEDPVYPPVLDLLTAMGATPVPVAIDDEGLCPDALRVALSHRPRALVTVPRAQNPAGAAVTADRARELQELLDRHEPLLLIEDDHAAGIAGAPFETLAGPQRGRWGVVRSVSKSLNPDLRLAVIAGDEITISRLQGRQSLGTGWVSTILQRTVAALWADPATERILARAQDEYRLRREALINSLAECGITAHGRTGLNVWVPVREEAAAVESLLASGWAVQAGERFRLRSAPGLRITISTVQPDETPELAAAIAATQRSRAIRPLVY
jgi:DNA-binding transcriptional MocR family regulator